MRSFLIPAIFLVTFVCTAFLGEMVMFRYVSTTQLSLIGESSLWQQSAPQATKTLSLYAQTADFAKKTTTRYPNTVFMLEHEDSNTALRDFWRRHTDVLADGTVLKMRSYSDSAFDAEQLLRAMINTLIAERTNVLPEGAYRLTVLELPYQLSFGIWQWLLYGIVAMIVAGSSRLFFSYAPLSQKPFATNNRNVLPRTDELRRRFETTWKRQDEKNEIADSVLSLEKDTVDEVIKKSNEDGVLPISQELEIREKKSPTASIVSRNTASSFGFVPSNLPIVEEKETNSVSETNSSDAIVTKESDEPSNEEYKRRLNELLQGKWN